MPEAAARAPLARGATLGRCGGPPTGAACQDKLFGVCTVNSLGGGSCDPDLQCTSTAAVFVTACQLLCDTDDDCRRKYPTSKLVCRHDVAVWPFEKSCCVPG